MRKVKICLLAILLVGLATVTLINEIGTSRYPPAGGFPDGAARGFYPSDVRSCMGARALAAVGDRTRQVPLCEDARSNAGDLRYWSLMLPGAFTLASVLGFALTLRFDRPPARGLRGRQPLTGGAARRAFAQTLKMECRRRGQGLEVLSGRTVSRERETRHWLIWGSVGAGKTQSLLHPILAAIARGDGVLVLDSKVT